MSATFPLDDFEPVTVQSVLGLNDKVDALAIFRKVCEYSNLNDSYRRVVQKSIVRIANIKLAADRGNTPFDGQAVVSMDYYNNMMSQEYSKWQLWAAELDRVGPAGPKDTANKAFETPAKNLSEVLDKSASPFMTGINSHTSLTGAALTSSAGSELKKLCSHQRKF